MKFFLVCISASLFLSQFSCKRKAETPNLTSLRTSNKTEAIDNKLFIGVEPCDQYVTKLRTCILKTISVDNQQQMLHALEDTRHIWQEAAKNETRKSKELPNACKTAMEIAKSARALKNCDWK